MEKNQYRKEPLKDNVEEMFIGPFGSSLKNECFVDERNAYCMVYEQKHAIQKTLAGKNRFVDRNKYQELKRFTVKPGDIIVSCRGTIGETFIIPENAPLGIMHPSIMKIRLKPNVYNIEYFNLLLKSRLEAYNKSANGSGIKMAISATELGKELFPIPPMDEQQKTSKIFLMVNHLILLRQQQLAKLDELVKAQFANTFENDANFHTDYMENLSEFVTVGIANSATHAYAEHGVVMLRNQNIKENHLDDTELVYIEPKFADKYKSKKLEANDILVTRTGYPGIACVVPQKYAGSQTFTTLIIRLKKETNVSSCYICHYINSSHGKKYVSGTKVGVAQQNFGAKVLAKMPVIVPPIELQNQFATFVARIDQQKQTVQQSLEKLELMKKALMQEFFG